MTRYEKLSEDYARLRNLAEERIKTWANSDSPAGSNLHHEMHELKIHLAEQEIRNEELRRRFREKDERFQWRDTELKNTVYTLFS